MSLPLTFLVTWCEMNLSFSISSFSAHPAQCNSCLVVCMRPSKRLEFGGAICKVPFHLLSGEHFLFLSNKSYFD